MQSAPLQYFNSWSPASVLVAGAFFVALLGAVGCGPSPSATDTAAVDPVGWQQGDTAVLSFEVHQAAHRYDLFISLRNNQDYPFSNAFLFVQLVSPAGRTLTDTLECPLALPDGRWLGRSWGRWVDHKIGYKPGIQFPVPGTYELRIVHAMRSDPLPGIASVGLDLFDRGPGR